MGTLYIVATPIGNLEDITIRAIKILLTVPVIACEDTRRTGQLLKHIHDTYCPLLHIEANTERRLVSYYDEIEEQKTPDIIQLLEQGIDVALVSDAGTPLINDPGYRLIQACLKHRIHIVSVPGASSVVAALSVSGLPTDQFLFLGYLPPSSGKRKSFLSHLLQSTTLSKTIHPTIVMFESPHRIQEALTDVRVVFGDVTVSIVRELTKVYEEVWRGTAADQIPQMKGEIIVLIRPPPSPHLPEPLLS